MNSYLRGVLIAAAILATLVLVAFIGFLGLRAYYSEDLPSVASLHDLKLGVPLRIYSIDGKLIGEFGAERRDPLRYDEIPKQLVQAFLAAEDDRFFEHPGFDWQGLARAGFKFATTGEKRQGGSTITMQLARNVFLTPERKFSRKFKEILLAMKIEKELSKEQILELYLNRIFLGNRSYGIGAAAEGYFGKKVSELSLSEMATLAALPKAPSRDNPISNPTRSQERRDYVLRRMRELNFITADQFQLAMVEPITAHEHVTNVDLEARYVAEMVRSEMVAKHGEAAYTDGYSVTTTIEPARQAAATAALRNGLLTYSERHGYDAPEARIPDELLRLLQQDPGNQELREQLEARPPLAGLTPAVVLEFSPTQLRVLTAAGTEDLPKTAFEWAHLEGKNALTPGDIIRIAKVNGQPRLAQIPDVQGAFVAVDPRDGAVQALVGGYDFFMGEYNRVTQARRQVGSGFKPFLYTAALSKGYNPASVFLDAPVVFASSISPDDDWRPGNYNGRFNGPMRLRDALAKSRNLVSVRVAQALGIEYVRNFATRFGIPKARMPADLTLALGSASLTPWEMARAYSVIANGGFYVEPYLISSIRDVSGTEIFKADPKIACPSCDTVPASAEQPAPADPATDAALVPDGGIKTQPLPAVAPPPESPPVDESHRAKRVLDAQLDWMITSMMHDVVTRGTAAQVNGLGRNDLGGKTGTTNDFTDVWFNGIQPSLVAITWIGYDQPQSLGRGEDGARTAVPVYMDFARTALKGVPSMVLPRPSGLVEVAINPENGKLVAAGTPGAITDVVQRDHMPSQDDGKSLYGETPASTEIY